MLLKGILGQTGDFIRPLNQGDPGDDFLMAGGERGQDRICAPCAKNRPLDEANFFINMQRDGGPAAYPYGGRGQGVQFII